MVTNTVLVSSHDSLPTTISRAFRQTFLGCEKLESQVNNMVVISLLSSDKLWGLYQQEVGWSNKYSISYSQGLRLKQRLILA